MSATTHVMTSSPSTRSRVGGGNQEPAMIGVLAVQGAFALHARAVERLGYRSLLVRDPADFDRLDGLILPGGESTVQLDMIGRLGLEAPLSRALGRLPVLATCAGLILVARAVDGGQRSFGFVDVTVARNAWGRQVDSFEATSDGGRSLVFIRAPRISNPGARVDVLDTLTGEPVLVRDGRITCATFHPELTASLDIHRSAFAGLARDACDLAEGS
jgi:pyridoxal 5'-phosphate synthase pdxT subunit